MLIRVQKKCKLVITVQPYNGKSCTLDLFECAIKDGALLLCNKRKKTFFPFFIFLPSYYLQRKMSFMNWPANFLFKQNINCKSNIDMFLFPLLKTQAKSMLTHCCLYR